MSGDGQGLGEGAASGGGQGLGEGAATGDGPEGAATEAVQGLGQGAALGRHGQITVEVGEAATQGARRPLSALPLPPRGLSASSTPRPTPRPSSAPGSPRAAASSRSQSGAPSPESTMSPGKLADHQNQHMMK